MTIKAIYDDGGKNVDRYTVYFDAKNPNGLYDCLVMSDNPTLPLGVSQHSQGMLGRHNGKKIAFTGLPLACQKLVLKDLGYGWV